MKYLRCTFCDCVLNDSELVLKSYQDDYALCGRVFVPCCPNCGNDEFDDVELCTVCDEYSDEIEEGLCPKCQKEAEDKLRRFLINNFNANQIAFLRDVSF